MSAVGAEDDTSPFELTTAQIAERVAASAKQYESVEYVAEAVDLRNANLFRSDQKPVWFSLPESYRYIGDGTRFLIETQGHTYRIGSPKLVPSNWSGGFTGKVHHSTQDGTVTLGTEELRGRTRSAVNTFFSFNGRFTETMSSLQSEDARTLEPKRLGGVKCVVVETVRSYQGGKSVRRDLLVLAPERNWLPLRQERYINGKRIIARSLSKLTQAGGIWFPERMRYEREKQPIPYAMRNVRVTEFRRRPDFADADFAPPVRTGVNVKDNRIGAVAWHADPWWDDLAPWLKKELHWPTPSLLALWEIPSYTDGSVKGKQAPPLIAAEWVNGRNPGAWDRPGRKVTLVYFYGGRLINPHPKWVNAVRELLRQFGPQGLDVIAIATPDTPELTKQAARELALPFPVAIDAKGDSYGKTHAAFGLKSYAGIVMVDHAGIVHEFERASWKTSKDRSPIQLAVATALRKAGVKDVTDGPPSQVDLHDIYKPIVPQWRKLVAKAPKDGVIHGLVTDGKEAIANASIQLRPQLRLLSSNNTSGTLVLPDRDRTQTIRTDKAGSFEFKGLPKGYYELIFSAPGRAKINRLITVGADLKPQQADVELDQSHELAGRVVDESGEPVAAAVVKVLYRHFDPKDLVRHTTAGIPRVTLSTGVDGRFEFDSMYRGWFTIGVTYKGELLKFGPFSAGTEDAELKVDEPQESEE